MALPPADLALIEQYCAAGSPAEFADRARLECDVKGSAVDIVEATRMDADFGGDWLRVPAARLSYNAATGSWTLFCFDRDSRPQRYDLWEPDFGQPGTVAEILAEIEADPTDIFWG
jgi:hypothetical protein